ncbi:MAG: hypothetical protein OEM29_04040 [Thermoplasmata archaeon]|nr:hypothetical protein [Thermoplasmata archaeon]
MGTRVGILLALSVIMMFVMPLFSVPVAGDGLASRYDTARDAWYTLAERDQFCIINYDDGIEKMIVQIQLDGSELRSSEKIAWLFPIPALPESVSLRHFRVIPRFDGYSLGSAVLEKVADSTSWSFAFGTQLYTAPALGYYATLGFGGSSGIEDSVESYAILNQYGVTTEVLAVDSSEALGVYLTSKELALPEEAELAIENYLDGDYSFVLSWVSSVSSFLTQAFKIPGTDTYSLGIGVEFPCDGIFFPLEMTSAYDTLEIPITVQVLDHVTPDEYPSGGNLDFSCKYRVQDTFRPTEFLEKYIEEFDYFFAEQIAANDGSLFLKSVDYTVVRFDGPAGELTEDLWLSDSRPLSVSSLQFVGDHPWLVVLAVFILVSCISSLVACVIIFGWNARLTRTYIILGAANLFSIAGYYFAYDAVTPRLERENVNTERKGWRLMLLFSGLFIYQLGFVYFVFFYRPTVGM